MQPSNSFFAITVFSACVTAADLSGYKAGTGVEAGLRSFLIAYFPFSEDPASTTQWTSWWAESGSLTFRGLAYTGSTRRLALKQQIFPSGGNIRWNHIVTDVVVQSESATSKTYSESVVVEIRNTATETCSGFRGEVVAEIEKNAAGQVDLTLHGGNYLTYVLNLPSTANSACTF